MIDGILLIDKEVGITSYDVIRRLKKTIQEKIKIGHTGTLDPFASGLLVILLGKGTKLMNTFHTYEKVYEVEAILGFSTDTQDIEGKEVEKDLKSIKPTKEEIVRVIEREFLGDILQKPPMYSAKMVKGERAYFLARRGEYVDLEPKKVYVSQFEVYEYEYPTLKCKIKCSTGTYIRTLVHDLGIKLGTYATSKNLRRTSIGSFNVSESIKSMDIVELGKENILRRVINV